MKVLLFIKIFTCLLITGQTAFSQSSPSTTKDGIEVEYSTLMKIAKKYGVDKNFQFIPSVNNKTGKLPSKVTLKMSIYEFEEWMKQVAFEEKRTAILQQFYLKDYQEIKDVKQYTALKRYYLKMYPEYLRNVPAFQESTIQKEEKDSNLVLNSKNLIKQ